MNVKTAILDIENALLVARSFAFFADQFHIRQELHFHGHGAIALAIFAPPAWNIEREMTCRVAAALRLRSACEDFANQIECFHISDWIRTRRSDQWAIGQP